MEVVSGGDEGEDHTSDMDSGMAGQVRPAKPHKRFASCAVRSVYGTSAFQSPQQQTCSDVSSVVDVC